jgi:hypothetical protein
MIFDRGRECNSTPAIPEISCGRKYENLLLVRLLDSFSKLGIVIFKPCGDADDIDPFFGCPIDSLYLLTLLVVP